MLFFDGACIVTPINFVKWHTPRLFDSKLYELKDKLRNVRRMIQSLKMYSEMVTEVMSVDRSWHLCVGQLTWKGDPLSSIILEGYWLNAFRK
jgi:hypothetical protein